MTRRTRTQEEHAKFEGQTSTHIQMIVSAIEGSNKELIATIKKKNKETRANICKENKETRGYLPKIAEEFQKKLAEMKNSKSCKSPILEKINECTSHIASLFTYQTKAQQHIYKTDIEVHVF